jgi:large subunit ribosomal protein L24
MRPKSKRPSKQRNYQRSTPKNEVHKVMSANLSPDLRSKKGFRSLPVVKGDTVVVTRGSMKGKSGRIVSLDPGKQRVFVDKVIKRKTDNTEIPVPIHPSNLMITKYVEKDRRRMELINRRIKSEDEKIDIDSVLAESVDDLDDVLEIDDNELDTGEEDLDDVELVEDVSDDSDDATEEES